MHLFRYEDLSALVEGGEPRLVPVPVGGAPPRPPGTWVLRVVEGQGGLEPEDLVLSVAGYPIQGSMLVAEAGAEVQAFDRLVEVDGRPVLDAYDAHWLGEAHRPGDAQRPGDERTRARTYVFERFGERIPLRASKLSALARVLEPRRLVELGGVPLEVYRDGRVEELEAPVGLRTRTTAAPCFATPESLLGATPLPARELAPGSYLALLAKPGYESLRLPFVLERGRPLALRAVLLPAGTSPPGFVRVAAGAAAVGGDAEAFASLAATTVELDDYWIQEREVAVLEYLEFVNAPATLEEIDAAPQTILVPRDVATGPEASVWPRLADGTFEPPAHTRDQPVHGISWHDARAYARWLTARALEQGLPYEYSLPTEVEWEKAARGADRRAYVFGNRFVPRWVKGFFARDQLLLEPSLRFPIDESPYGVFDLTGNLWEWCADEWQAGRALRGGGWNFTFPPFFRAASRAGQSPEAADGLLRGAPRGAAARGRRRRGAALGPLRRRARSRRRASGPGGRGRGRDASSPTRPRPTGGRRLPRAGPARSRPGSGGAARRAGAGAGRARAPGCAPRPRPRRGRPSWRGPRRPRARRSRPGARGARRAA